MSNTNYLQTQSGERLTFFQLFDEKNYNIEIPIIQRDYAQGRKSTAEVRNMFLDALYDYLEENKKNRDLDFVYGSLVDSEDNKSIKFIPLDGQQRLTTLFLLHWYLANKDGDLELFNEKLVNDNKSKFTYETRTSSREFCDALLLNSVDLNKLLPPDKEKNNALSKTIKDSSWYFLSWKNDPTIEAMLIMLDAINLKFKGSNNFFERLISPDNPVITFQFLNLNEFKLTDDLYIKMNARGKSLTPFENFKAKFEQLIKGFKFENAPQFNLLFNSIEKEVSLQGYFSYKIDTDWANLFWNYRDTTKNIFDDQIMNFIRAFAINHLANKSNDANDLVSLKYLLDKQNVNITFQKYIELKCFDEKFVLELIQILNFLKNGDSTIKLYLKDNFHFDEVAVFTDIINNSFSDAAYTHRIKFYALCQYLIKFETTVGLEDWMRVICNLTENTAPYNNENEFRRSIKSVQYLVQIGNTILTNLSLKTLNIEGFNDHQIKEEIIKSILILRDEKWANLIYETERKHKYFNGQISFLLNFSDIENSMNSINNWDEITENELFDSLIQYSTKAKTIFSSNGLRKLDNYIFQRALLSKGDYLIKEGSNYSFLINKDRDISWKRLLLGDKEGGKEKRSFVKDLFDDENFDNNDIDKGLRKIISNSIKTITNWRFEFISTPAMFSYLGTKQYIRYYADSHIYLLLGERMSGRHIEFKTFSYFHKHLKDKKLLPFNETTYYEISGETDEPCAVIYDWKFNKSNYQINIYFDASLKKFKLHFFDVKNKPFDELIINVLNNNNFKKCETYVAYDLLVSENDIAKKINRLTEDFQNIVI